MRTYLIKYSSCKKKACRAIHNLPFNTHTTEYFKNAKIPKLTDLYESQISKHMLKLMFKFKCEYFTDTFWYSYNYSTRNNNKFIAPKCNMIKSEMSINFKSIKVWNKLSADIRTSYSFNVYIYVDNLRNYYLSRYWVHHYNVFFFCDMLCLCVMWYQL